MPLNFCARFRLVCLAVAAFPGHSFAFGLGPAVGQLLLGQPVNVAIPLIDNPGQRVDASCFRLSAPAAPADADYVLRDARLRLERASEQTRLIVVGQRNWPHPVLEFRVVASCDGAQTARDYVLLAALPALAPEVTARRPEAEQSVLPVRRPTTPASGDTLTLTVDSRLNLLARSRYPEDRAARDEFRRLMVMANPELFAGKGPVGAVPLPAGTVLTLPPDLSAPGNPGPAPVLRPKGKSLPAVEKKPDQLAGPVKGSKIVADRLMVSGKSTTAAQALSLKEIERLDQMLEEQISLQNSVNEKFKNLEAAFETVTKNQQVLDERFRQVDAERIRAEEENKSLRTQLAEEREKFGVVETLLLVLAAGVLGGGLIFYNDRLQTRRRQMAAAPSRQAPVAVQANAVADAAEAEGLPTQDVAAPLSPPVNAFPPETLSEPAMVLELADVLTSMGLTEKASQTLVEHIRANPAESVQHWLKLLDLYHKSDLDDTLAESLAKSVVEFKGKFNVAFGEWVGQPASLASSLMDHQHIAQKLVLLWKTGTCDAYLVDLLVDTRGGTRQGFPRALVEEIILLRAILGEVRLGC